MVFGVVEGADRSRVRRGGGSRGRLCREESCLDCLLGRLSQGTKTVEVMSVLGWERLGGRGVGAGIIMRWICNCRAVVMWCLRARSERRRVLALKMSW